MLCKWVMELDDNQWCWCFEVLLQLGEMTCGSIPSCKVDVAFCCWRSCLKLPQSHAAGERGCPRWMRALATSSSHSPPPWSPGSNPGQNQPSWPVSSVSFCPVCAPSSPADHCIEKSKCHHSVIKCPEQSSAHSKGPQSSQHVETTLALLLQDVCVVWPIYCWGEHPGIYGLHHLNVQTLEVHLCSLGCLPPVEDNDHLLCLNGVELEMVLLTPVDKVSDYSPVLSIVPLRYTPDDGCIIRELQEVTAQSCSGSPNCTGWRERLMGLAEN